MFMINFQDFTRVSRGTDEVLKISRIKFAKLDNNPRNLKNFHPQKL